MPDGEKIRVALLPGLHGTAQLFEDFIAKCPPNFEAIPISYPVDRVLGYDALVAELGEQITNIRPNIILGESFAGPLALRIAAVQPNGVIAVVLVASFVLAPAPRWIRYLPWKTMFRLRTPLYVIRA